jgi:hypothetical protein
MFLFGEAEKGEFCTPRVCKSLPQLADTFGNPPQESQGILYGIQALLYRRELIFFRVEEEGFSVGDYMKGIKWLQQQDSMPELAAICMPGVGDVEILEATSPLCIVKKSCLIINEKDLYDYLTAQGA